MIFTYTAEYAVFSESQDFNSVKGTSVSMSSSSILSFNEFLEKNWDRAHEEVSLFGYSLKDGYSLNIIDSMMRGISAGKTTVLAWYQWLPIVDEYNYDQAGVIFDYKGYLSENGYSLVNGVPAKTGTNFVDDAQAFLGNIGNAIGKFAELLTFSIKDTYGNNIIPQPVMAVLLIFFVPFWIVIGIEMLPILVALVHAIGALLDSVTPLT
jgi:hypothetical protein